MHHMEQFILSSNSSMIFGEMKDLNHGVNACRLEGAEAEPAQLLGNPPLCFCKVFAICKSRARYGVRSTSMSPSRRIILAVYEVV